MSSPGPPSAEHRGATAVRSALARFHFARRPMLDGFLRETPDRIVELLGDPAPQRRTTP